MKTGFKQQVVDTISLMLHEDHVKIAPFDSSSFFHMKRITTSDGHYIYKYSDIPENILVLRSEYDGLTMLSDKTSTPKLVGIVDLADHFGILMQEIDRLFPIPSEALEQFGVQIAELHRHSSDMYGLDYNNYISKLPQINEKTASWPEFYTYQRIEPLYKKLYDQKAISMSFNPVKWEKRIALDVPPEKPSLLHGDLWGGNYLVGKNKVTYVIDPAIYYGHREMDLAMSMLFGSFGRTFYSSYQKTFPLEAGFMERMQLHQFYPLLVHAVMFGGAYVHQCISILKTYQS